MNARLRARRREAHRVIDVPGRDLAVANEPRQNRQTGRVGRRPVLRSQRGRPEIPVDADVRVPVVGTPERAPELVEMTRSLLHDEDVAIAGARRSTFDGCVRRNRERPGITLVAVRGVANANLRLRRRHNLERDAVRAAATEVGMQVRVTRAGDVLDVRRRVAAHRFRVDRNVPRTRRREHGAATDGRCGPPRTEPLGRNRHASREGDADDGEEAQRSGSRGSPHAHCIGKPCLTA